MTEPKDVLEIFDGLHRAKIPGGKEFYSVEAHAGNTEANVSIYDEIGMWGITSGDFAAAINGLPQSVKKINLHLNSPGGSVFDGLAIANVLRGHAASVAVTVDGVAASIASVIAMAGDSVTMGRGSQMMIHNPSGIVMGGSADMRQMADLLDKLALDSIATAYAGKAGEKGGTSADWLARMSAETWFSGPEAVALGLADDCTDGNQADPAADLRHHDLTAFGFAHAGREAAPDPLAEDRRNRSRATVARVRTLRKECK